MVQSAHHPEPSRRKNAKTQMTNKVQNSNVQKTPHLRELCHNPLPSLRATKGSVAISFFTTLHEIASVVLLSRNDIMTLPQGSEGIGLTYHFLFIQHSTLDIRCSFFLICPGNFRAALPPLLIIGSSQRTAHKRPNTCY